ncbi:MAG: peptide chain release factor N(5)-glutamine methyltransferase [Acidobacteria bacterium]|nr:MAG: peptide chain release factor N(5)-glutamine methyltransferase [Acidobacteriota bacterium]REK03644.1 MAG: peptide chain release factor N(5)-glutamine methyltransferase [Acidobacteriota bacterium]
MSTPPGSAPDPGESARAAAQRGEPEAGQGDGDGGGGPPTDVASLLAALRRLLEDSTEEIQAREASWLLAHASGLDESRLIAFPERRLDPAVAARAVELARRRAAATPFAYLVGEREFYGRTFRVDPRVLIPRPETEHLIDAVLELDLPEDARVLDVGAGSGCIAITLQLERPSWRVVACDLSLSALAVARHNARRLGAPVGWFAADLLAPLTRRGDTLDVVVSNPPYVDPADRQSLPRVVVEHEPHLALFADGGGLEVYQGLLSGAGIAAARHLVVELGAGQLEAVRALAREAGRSDAASVAECETEDGKRADQPRFRERSVHRDLAEHARVLVLEAHAPGAGCEPVDVGDRERGGATRQ